MPGEALSPTTREGGSEVFSGAPLGGEDAAVVVVSSTDDSLADWCP